MKYLAYCVLMAMPLVAQESKYERAKVGKPAPTPYDADLYKKNVEVATPHMEFLYWTVEEGALDYALKMNDPAWGPTPAYAVGDYQNGTYNLDPGFRVGVSYFNAPKYWELNIQYTRVTNRGADSANKPTPAQDFLTGTWPTVLGMPVNSAKAYTHLNYNVGDLRVSRVFHTNPHLRMKMLLGLSTAWISQDWRIYYLGDDNQTTKVKSHWNYNAGGLRIGTAADWFWGNDIYLTGITSTALFMGKYTNHSFQKTNVQATGNDNPSLPLRNTRYADVRAAFAVQVLLGPSWQKNYPNTRWEVFAGYELTSWFNLQEVYRSSASSASQAKETWINTSILSLHGLTTRLSIDY